MAESRAQLAENNHLILNETSKVAIKDQIMVNVPGEFVSVARRSGNPWFMGTITNAAARIIKLKFDFLPEGKTYLAKIYSDNGKVNTATQVGVETRSTK